MNTQIADCLFLSRAMGIPVPAGKDPLKWTRGALANPECRVAGMATIEALLYQVTRVRATWKTRGPVLSVDDGRDE